MKAHGRGEDPTLLSDEELLPRVARIEAASFAVLYERHSAAAYSLARRMLGASGAEDVVQEAFLNLWRNATMYDASRGAGRSWLLALVRNRSIDALRRQGADGRRIAMGELEARIAAEESVDLDVITDLARRERAERLRSALAALPCEQRRVLELAYFGGWTQAEIAEYLELPLGTVKGRTNLGLGKLRGVLGLVVPAWE